MMNRIPFNHSNNIAHIYTHRNGTNLWMGNCEAAMDLKLLQNLAITASSVLTIADGLKVTYDKSSKKQHLIIRALDMPSYKIREHFGNCNKFIYQNLAKGRNVLVHSSAGISRSAAVITAFLIKRLNFDFRRALDHLKSRRPQSCPNYGFMNQLQMNNSLQLISPLRQAKIETQQYTKLNQVSFMIKQLRQVQRRKLRYNFQLNRHRMSVESSKFTSVQSSYRNHSEQKPLPKLQRMKIKTQASVQKQQRERHFRVKRKISSQDTILFPRIVVVQKFNQKFVQN